jgi:hypothetical protein
VRRVKDKTVRDWFRRLLRGAAAEGEERGGHPEGENDGK